MIRSLPRSLSTSNKVTRFAILVVTLSALTGCLGGGGEGGEATTLGLSCGDCNGTFCSSGGGSVEQVCRDSDLPDPCWGTGTGMFCSQSCDSDEDCATSNRAMRCLETCPDFPEAAGKCWSQSDAQFMTTTVCPL